MGAGASLQEDVPTGWHALAAMAEAADKPDLVAKIVRENQIDAATALKLDDDDLRELVDRKLDFKKLQGARDELRERLGPARAGTHLVSSDSEDGASDGGDIPPHVSRIPDDEIDRAEALDARGGVFAATWRPCKGQPVAVALKAVDAVDLAEVFALRSFADPNVLVLYGVLVAGSSDVATVAERPDAALDVILCGNPLPRVDSLRVARDMASALTFLHSRVVAHLRLAPSNVLCHRAPHLRCKVADFGASVSAAIERLERNPRARAYAAPELLEAVRAPSGGRRAPRPVRVRRLGLRLRDRRGSLGHGAVGRRRRRGNSCAGRRRRQGPGPARKGIGGGAPDVGARVLCARGDATACDGRRRCASGGAPRGGLRTRRVRRAAPGESRGGHRSRRGKRSGDI